ncbi:glucan biosynthesis protein [Chelativorans salis]|uniref:Glucan biosynthesis protein G n=1 Tax=Chelativorans salis TaxID=2978478 RepID=A0ABT2LHG0_9HYPH|nr:glucan biosynthesis protein G [Chelativorans sp. EGI FJ00035]MCT7373689.1 glucan biosynthesis protein G [Chelativorans sp. EGI FJ00035]
MSAVFGVLSSSSASLKTSRALASEGAPKTRDEAVPFSFDILSEAMEARATEPYEAPSADLPKILADLTYDQHRAIRYRPERALWKGEAPFGLQAFHLGWLFKEPVNLHVVEGGAARPLVFSGDDFEYRPPLKADRFKGLSMPGVAGFRLHHPLNDPEIMDELVAFLGASYFRALGRGNVYGLSARGIAVDTATTKGEEFPRFTDFYIELPGHRDKDVTLYAALDGPSVTGAYAFRIMPGDNTQMEVTTRLYMRRKVERLGIAPMTSMFFFGENNSRAFDDYRAEVHDSDGLKIVRAGGEEIWRSLNNPSVLANSFFEEENPEAFGLFQRDRNFEDYQDGGAAYHRRPSLLVEPLGEWGKGFVHLIEIPTSLEINDNIVAYWVPEGEFTPGRTLEFSYRLTWGAIGERGDGMARVLGLRTGIGGVSGLEEDKVDKAVRKFVIDFEGDILRKFSDDPGISASISVGNGKIEHSTVSPVLDDTWRLAVDVRPNGGDPVEISAFLNSEDRRLSETWMYQWRRGDGNPS